MTRPGRELVFYFDYISHNAYLAWTQLRRLEEEFGVAVRPVPVLFAGLLNAHGQLGPAEVPAKARWMSRNVLRKASILGLELNPPVHHPFNPLLSLRASSLELPEAERWRLIEGLFQAVWVNQKHVSEPGVVAEVATAAGLDGAEIVERAELPESKRRVREQTDGAIASGVFGVPTMIVHDELFFGYDDLPYMERVLAGDDPMNQEMLERWKASRSTPSAVRRRPDS